MIQILEYKDETGRVKRVNFDTTYGLHPNLSSSTIAWSVVATAGSLSETTDFEGIKPKRKTT